MKVLSFEKFLNMEKRRIFSLSKMTLKESINNFDDLQINQKIFLRFYLYYLFQIKDRKINLKEYLIIKEYLEKYPKYKNVENLYNNKPHSFIDIIKNLRNYDLYRNRQKIIQIKISSFREALEDKQTRINFIKKTGISSPAVTKFRNGTDYAISEKTFEKDSNLMNIVKEIFQRKKEATKFYFDKK